MLKLDLEKAEEAEIKLPIFVDHKKGKKVPEKNLLSLYRLPQSVWLCDHNKLWKILKEMGIPDHLTTAEFSKFAGILSAALSRIIS